MSTEDEGDSYENVVVNDQIDAEEKSKTDKAKTVTSQPGLKRDSQNSEYCVVSQQPSSTNTKDAATPREGDHVEGGGDGDELDKEGPSGEVEFKPNANGCVSASAGVGSVSKDICGGSANLECIGPNVGCELSQGDGCELVSDCTTELCSANVIVGVLMCTFGLALDTTVKWNDEGAEFKVLGTGAETDVGFALSLFGSKIGYVDKEKMKKLEEKRRKRADAGASGKKESKKETNKEEATEEGEKEEGKTEK